MSSKSGIRGIRNKNPFNIRKSMNNNWLGKIDGSDRDFETFNSMVLGLRAGLKLLFTYIDRGDNTIEKIIQRFAPPSENSTNAYIEYVQRDSRGFVKYSRDMRITRLGELVHVASRIIKYECCLTDHQMGIYCFTPSYLLDIIDNYKLNKIGLV